MNNIICLYCSPDIFGISDHDLLFSKEEKRLEDNAFDDEIQARV